MAGERGKGQRGDELLGRFRHHDVHIQRLALQGSHQFGRFISGNAPRDTDSDLHSVDCTTGAWESPSSGAKALSIPTAYVRPKGRALRLNVRFSMFLKGTGFTGCGKRLHRAGKQEPRG